MVLWKGGRFQAYKTTSTPASAMAPKASALRMSLRRGVVAGRGAFMGILYFVAVLRSVAYLFDGGGRRGRGRWRRRRSVQPVPQGVHENPGCRGQGDAADQQDRKSVV